MRAAQRAMTPGVTTLVQPHLAQPGDPSPTIANWGLPAALAAGLDAYRLAAGPRERMLKIDAMSFRGAGICLRAGNPSTPLLEIRRRAPFSWVPGLPKGHPGTTNLRQPGSSHVPWWLRAGGAGSRKTRSSARLGPKTIRVRTIPGIRILPGPWCHPGSFGRANDVVFRRSVSRAKGTVDADLQGRLGVGWRIRRRPNGSHRSRCNVRQRLRWRTGSTEGQETQSEKRRCRMFPHKRPHILLALLTFPKQRTTPMVHALGFAGIGRGPLHPSRGLFVGRYRPSSGRSRFVVLQPITACWHALRC
jgi:hypothetical protein